MDDITTSDRRIDRGTPGGVVRFYVWDGDHLLIAVDSTARPTLVREYS